MMNGCGDIVVLRGGFKGRIVAVRFHLDGRRNGYDVRLEELNRPTREDVPADEIEATLERGRHAYWKPDPKRTNTPRGHCYRCGVRKKDHP